jgi:hypothetical protein
VGVRDAEFVEVMAMCEPEDNGCQEDDGRGVGLG